MIIAIWIVTALLVALWTLGAWAVASVLATDGSWIVNIEPWLSRIPFGGWLETWIPDWLQIAHALLNGAQALLGWLGGAAPVLVWVLWAAGAFVLVLLAAALSLLVVLIRKSTPVPPPQPPVATA